jgi:hypothetical protein
MPAAAGARALRQIEMRLFVAQDRPGCVLSFRMIVLTQDCRGRKPAIT